MTKRWTVALVVVLALAVSAFTVSTRDASPGRASTSGTARGGIASGPAHLTKALAAIEDLQKYEPSDWGYVVLDQKSGKVLASQNANKMFDPGSTMKTFAVSTALRLYGNDYKFTTPVYREGTIAGDTLKGNLVLVASGDLTLGLRQEPNGSLFYENLPEVDHSYANIGLPGAVEPPGNPLGVLDQFAASVKAAGITRVNGNVVIDDRLFDTIKWPDGLVSPIWVNENLIDIEVMPGTAAGQPTTVDWRPKSATYTVESQATTVDANETTDLEVTEPTPGHLVVTGTIAAGNKPTLVVKEIDDPSAFARTAFIEALQRAGVTVTAAPTGPNPAALLPAKDSYQPGDKVAEHVSTTLAEYVKLIMKVSYNRGADLMTCLSAAKTGSTDCNDGLTQEVKTFSDLGVSKTSTYPFDGAGSNDQNRVTPTALATFYKAATQTPYAKALHDSLPILGKDGTLATSVPNSPAAGKAQIKTGNRVVGTPAGQLLLLGNTLAGYIQAKSGRELTCFIGVVNVPLATTADFLQVTADQAEMVVAIQQAF